MSKAFYMTLGGFLTSFFTGHSTVAYFMACVMALTIAIQTIYKKDQSKALTMVFENAILKTVKREEERK